MEIDYTQFKYGEYKRKSSKEKDKQSQSIRTQERELSTVKAEHNLQIVLSWAEKTTAFEPYVRPKFDELVEATRRGTINAWLVWHATRLSRNPIDAGTIIYLMDTGKLHHIRTPKRIYHNTPEDKAQLANELTNSKKDSDDKSAWIRENIETKAEKGVPHGMAKLGFRNSKYHPKGAGYWLVDEENFGKVRQVLQLFNSGKYSVRQLYAIANDELKLRTPGRENSGGKVLSRAYFYKLLGDPIYAGFFNYNVFLR